MLPDEKLRICRVGLVKPNVSVVCVKCQTHFKYCCASSKMEGMEATTDLFINLIQNNRIIYDKSLKDFKNTRKKEDVWLKIANQSRMTGIAFV